MDDYERWAIENKYTGKFWTPKNFDSDFYTFDDLKKAKDILLNLDSSWMLKKVVLFDVNGTNHFFSDLPSADQPLDYPSEYQPPVGSIASKIIVARGEHILVCGEVQIGKLKEKHELIVLLRERYKLPVLVLFRNNNVDYHQFSKRRHEFNEEQRKKGLPVIPQPSDILQHKESLHELIKEPNVILGLANPETIAIIDKCLAAHPELQSKLVVIMDEADLVTFELEGQNLRTKTEENLLSLFNKIYMLISVTGTPGSILLCDKESQVYVIDRPDEYYGIDRIKHVNLMPIRAKRKNQQYNPALDDKNLKKIMGDILSLPTATLLILVSRLRREHKSVISYLTNEYTEYSSEIVYLELNEKSVKVYNGHGKLIDSIGKKTFKGTKVGPIDIAIQQYKDSKYIVIVAGVLAGRGVSFVSEDYTRHLSHQYIADAESCHLESAMQSVRLLGKYYDDPTLTLYCSNSLYQDLLSQCSDMAAFSALAIDSRTNKNRLPDIIACQKEYDHNWFPSRKNKGIAFVGKKSSTFTLEAEDFPVESDYYIDNVLSNYANNFPQYLLHDHWPGGGLENGSKERVIYCNPIADFTPEGIVSFYKNRKQDNRGRKVKEEVYNKLIANGYPHMESLVALYNKYPHYEGKIIRRYDKPKSIQGNLFIRK